EREGAREGSLANSRHVFDEQMPARDQGHDGQPDSLRLSANHGFDRRLKQGDFFRGGSGKQVDFALGSLQSSHVNSSNRLTCPVILHARQWYRTLKMRRGLVL